jgi:hypothetical protein
MPLFMDVHSIKGGYRRATSLLPTRPISQPKTRTGELRPLLGGRGGG